MVNSVGESIRICSAEQIKFIWPSAKPVSAVCDRW